MLNFRQLAEDYSIPVLDNSSHKHCQSGWIQLQDDCPFCTGNRGHHLGWNVRGGYFNCWRCGKHKTGTVVSTILDIPVAKALELINMYQFRPRDRVQIQADGWIPAENCSYIGSPGEIFAPHRKFLIKRGFDPDRLVHEWGIKGTGPCVDYALRIIAPIYYNSKLVTWYSRDVTDKANAKYLPCPRDLEVIRHKELLYGLWNVSSTDVGIVVEGMLDAWRFGSGTLATLGIDYTQKQVSLLSNFDKLFIIFDGGEVTAQNKAKQLGNELTVLGTDAEVIDLETGDPAELDQETADSIKKELV